MAYCTPDDVRTLTNIPEEDISDLAMTHLIEMADARCNSRIKEAGLPLPEAPTSATLKNASIHYTTALVIDRKRIDMSRPNNLSLGGDISIGLSTDTEILHQEQLGREALEQFISDTLETQGVSVGTIMCVMEGD